MRHPLAPGRARCRHRGGALSVLRRHAAFAVCIALSAGCSAARPPVPLDSRDDSAAAAPQPTPDERVDTRTPPIEEEVLPGDDGGAGAAAEQPAGDAGVGQPPPAVAQTIDADTAPNVAAATRLVDAARERMAARDDGTALDQLERAIAIDPANAYAYYYLAELHFSHRTYDQAIAFADRSASLSETREPEWASRAYTLQGNAFEAAGRFGDAREAYARALHAAPGNLAAQSGLARVGGVSSAQP